MSTNLLDHVAILTHSALAVPQQNKLKAAKPMEYYAVLAFPPTAAGALMALCIEGAHAFGGLKPDVQHGIKTNAQSKKPIAGIPDDWLLIRAATQYAPYVADATGAQLEQANPNAQAAIKAGFYAGKRVRAALAPFHWTHATGGRGVSYNLNGIMAAADGERLNIGTGVVASAFQQYADPNASASQAPGANAAVVAQGSGANPFAQQAAQTQTAAPAVSANPFAQTAVGNPFAPQAQAANPFAQSA